MADYFLILEAAAFEQRLRPALTAAWRQRSFVPCRALCTAMLPNVQEYGARYHASTDDSLVRAVAAGLAFDRTFWRTLVGELLLFSAVDIPEIQTCEDMLIRLIAPAYDSSAPTPRHLAPPIVQANHGSRDLAFGSAIYRPDYAGYNDPTDVARLADYLGTVQPAAWNAASLAPMTQEQAADEIEFAAEWFPVLAEIYRGARDRGQVIVHEQIY